MSAILQFLKEKAAAGEREWLRREPRETHPEILALVREAIAGGLFYDDDVERFVNERAGDLPPHVRHGHPDRGPLVAQLGHEVYLAKCIVRDERSTAEIMAALDDGYVPLADADVRDGGRYLLRCGKLYAGYAVAQYGDPLEVRARRVGERWAFLPKGARSRGYLPDLALVKGVTT